MFWAANLNEHGRAYSVTPFNTKRVRDLYVQDNRAKAITRQEAIKLVGINEIQQYRPCPELDIIDWR